MGRLTLSQHEIRAELEGIHPLILPDAGGAAIKHAFLVGELIPAWLLRVHELDLRYGPESRDCDKFARLFVAFCYESVIRSNEKDAALVGWMGVGDRGGHALCLARTSLGWLEIEPQNGARMPLRSPRDSIWYAVL
jgi:hypothetical protein